MQDRFAIRDVSTPTPIPSLSPTPAPSQVPPKKGKGRKRPQRPASPAKSAQPALTPVAFQYPNRRPRVEPTWIGEKFSYEVTYFGVAAGLFTLEALPFQSVGDRKVYHILGTATSSKLFSLFYRLNDTVETYIDYEGLFSHRFQIILNETKQERNSLELYDSVKAQTFYWNRWNRKDAGYVETKDFKPISPFTQDSLSALYYLRTLDLPDGAVVSFPVASEGNTWEAVITVIRREMMDSPLGKVRTLVVKPEAKYQGILQKRGDSFLWLTDDDRRILVRLEAKVKIGTIVGSLKKASPGTPP
jgi:hypothetical protein